MSIELPGFADPVAGAQACFRAVLEAMSRPGGRHAAGAGLVAPPPLDPATAAVLLTLADGDSRLWLAPGFSAATDWIVFHTGATLVADLAAADFVLSDTMPALAALAAGSDEAPQDSATLILQTPGFDRGPSWHLAGPGLRVPATLRADGLGDNFIAAWAANHALYPRGIDLILCAGETLAALPRSLRIGEG